MIDYDKHRSDHVLWCNENLPVEQIGPAIESYDEQVAGMRERRAGLDEARTLVEAHFARQWRRVWQVPLLWAAGLAAFVVLVAVVYSALLVMLPSVFL